MTRIVVHSQRVPPTPFPTVEEWLTQTPEGSFAPNRFTSKREVTETVEELRGVGFEDFDVGTPDRPIGDEHPHAATLCMKAVRSPVTLDDLVRMLGAVAKARPDEVRQERGKVCFWWD